MAVFKDLPEEILEEILLCLCQETRDEDYSGLSQGVVRLRRCTTSLPLVCKRWKAAVRRIGNCWVTTLKLILSINKSVLESPSARRSIDEWKSRLLSSSPSNMDVTLCLVYSGSLDQRSASLQQASSILTECILALGVQSHRIFRMKLVMPFAEPLISCLTSFKKMNRCIYLDVRDMCSSGQAQEEGFREVLPLNLDTSVTTLVVRDEESLLRITPSASTRVLAIFFQGYPYSGGISKNVTFENYLAFIRQTQVQSLLLRPFLPVGERPSPRNRAYRPKLQLLDIETTAPLFSVFIHTIRSQDLLMLEVDILDAPDDELGILDPLAISFPNLLYLNVIIRKWDRFLSVLLSAASKSYRLDSVTIVFDRTISVGRPGEFIDLWVQPLVVKTLRFEVRAALPDWKKVFSKVALSRVKSLTVRRRGSTEHVLTESDEIEDEVKLVMPVLRKLELDNVSPRDVEAFSRSTEAPLLKEMVFSANREIDSKVYRSTRYKPPFPRSKELQGLTPQIYERIESLTLPVAVFPLDNGVENPLTLFPNVQKLSLQLTLVYYSKNQSRSITVLALKPVLLERLLTLTISLHSSSHTDSKTKQAASSYWIQALERVVEWRRKNATPLGRASLEIVIGEGKLEDTTEVWSSETFSEKAGSFGWARKLLRK